uniref:Hypoxia-inducible factor 1 n=1 Tax=Phoronis psammophila TaxID=67897 RepID=A0AA96KE79_9BILA|nr:hypoxia-inducible factor 1 [Phoronis psammophila]
MPYKNSEKRKEKSRDAARTRRGKEQEVFTDLCNQLPLPNGDASQLDKASILRLAISVLKLRRMLGDDDHGLNLSSGFNRKLDQQYLKALEGFLIVISSDGDITYLSENVSKYLGLSQIDLVGQSVYEFSHPCDHDEIREMVTSKHSAQTCDNTERTFFTRLKCTLTNKGRNVNLKSATYKALRCTGRIIHQDVKPSLNDSDTIKSFLVMIAEPIPHPSNIEVPLGPCTFLSKHSLDMKFLYCDDRVYQLVGYTSEDLVGKSAYDYHHALDSMELEKSYKTLFSKGQSQIGQYRFLAKFGGYVWVMTQATVIHHAKTQKPQCIVCVNFVISGIEEDGKILADIQQVRSPLLLPVRPPGIFKEWDCNDNSNYGFTNGLPKIEEMSPDEQALYAPYSGEDTIPLYSSAFLQSENPSALDDYLKNEPTMYSCESMKEQNCASPEPHLMSHSPQSHNSSSPQHFTPGIFVDKGFDLEDLDLDMRAPYIPMSCDEEIGIFNASENIFTNAGDFGSPTKILGMTDAVFSSVPASPPSHLSVTTSCHGQAFTTSLSSPNQTQHTKTMSPLTVEADSTTVRTPPKGSPLLMGSPGGGGRMQQPKRKHSPDVTPDLEQDKAHYFAMGSPSLKRVHRMSPVSAPNSVMNPKPTVPTTTSSNKPSVLRNLLLRNDDNRFMYRMKQQDKILPALLNHNPNDKTSLSRKWSIMNPIQSRETAPNSVVGSSPDWVDLSTI